jgi:signal transduction histidine kinase
MDAAADRVANVPVTVAPLDGRYERLVETWLATRDEAVLRTAREFGDEVTAAGFGPRDIVDLHERVVRELSAKGTDPSVGPIASHALLRETLSAVERMHAHAKDALRARRHLHSQIEEQVRAVAHALHEETGQRLASVYLNVAEIATELPNHGRQRLEELRARLDEVDDQLRRLAQELRPLILDDFGLLAATEFFAEALSRRTGLRISVRGDTGGRLPADVETALYRVVQEALTNATRHSQPEHITVEFVRIVGSLKGSIRDDGSGFDMPAVEGGNGGLGLLGMRERMAAVGGRLSISSNPGSGTSIELEVPVESYDVNLSLDRR